MDKRRIIVSIPTSEYTQRQMLDGVLAYAREKHGVPWLIHIEPIGYSRQSIATASWHCDGIIAYIDNARQRERHLSANLPTVLIEPAAQPARQPAPPRGNVATFLFDHESDGRLAADYFLKRHFEHFAYLDSPEVTVWNELHRRGFAARLAEAGHRMIEYPRLSRRMRNDFACEQPRLSQWLAALPKRTAVFAAHDFRARQALIAADAAGLSVPDDFALLGVDNDTIMCETASPAISSIPINGHSVGRASARALEELMCGRAKGRAIVFPHKRVITRASTDTHALADPFVRKALDWISHNLHIRPTAAAIAEAINYPEIQLRNRFKSVLGTSLGREVRRIRLERARELITATSIPMAEIAAQCGFASPSHLGAEIHAAFHRTPVELRKETSSSESNLP